MALPSGNESSSSLECSLEEEGLFACTSIILLLCPPRFVVVFCVGSGSNAEKKKNRPSYLLRQAGAVCAANSINGTHNLISNSTQIQSDCQQDQSINVERTCPSRSDLLLQVQNSGGGIGGWTRTPPSTYVLYLNRNEQQQLL